MMLARTRTQTRQLYFACRSLTGAQVLRVQRPTMRPFSASQNNESRILPPVSSVQPDEVKKFDEVGSMWWEPNTASAPLLAMNPCRVGYITSQLNAAAADFEAGQRKVGLPLEGFSILDVGCGGGILSEALARCGASVVGIDPSKGVVEAAKNHSARESQTAAIEYQGGTSIESFLANNKGKKFDAICILEVLEHTDNPISLIRSASELLDEKGLLFVSTINKTLKSNLLAVVGAEHITRMIPVGTHEWSKFLSPESVRRMGEECGLSERDRKGMVVTLDSLVFSKFDATKFRWRLDNDDLDVNWIACYEKK